MNETNTPACQRCGQCCRAGGPALHREDIPLLKQGVIARARLVTLRKGEPVHENVAGTITELDREMVKLAGSAGGFACVFHDAGAAACLIHADRPAECRALSCRDTAAIEAMYRLDRLTRADIVDVSGALWELIVFHEQEFPASLAVALARRAASGDGLAAGRLEELAGAEDSFRLAFQERTGAAPGELDFYFGRTLRLVCAPLLAKLPGQEPLG